MRVQSKERELRLCLEGVVFDGAVSFSLEDKALVVGGASNRNGAQVARVYNKNKQWKSYGKDRDYSG